MTDRDQGSEVSQIRSRIEKEHQAAKWALTGLTEGQLRHRFISRRMEHISAGREKLAALVGQWPATAIVAAILEGDSPPESH